MQRARSSHGQVAVSTQSVSDVASATGNQQLLASLTDNFTGFVLHRQTSPESRDWLAMLLGTRELWQSTDRTSGGGVMLEGTGSRRRAAEFVVRPDEFKLLRPGEAIVWSTLGPPPVQVTVTPGPTLDPGNAGGGAVYRPLDIATIADALSGPAAAREAPEDQLTLLDETVAAEVTPEVEPDGEDPNESADGEVRPSAPLEPTGTPGPPGEALQEVFRFDRCAPQPRASIATLAVRRGRRLYAATSWRGLTDTFLRARPRVTSPGGVVV
jgi:hypothetical protein